MLNRFEIMQEMLRILDYTNYDIANLGEKILRNSLAFKDFANGNCNGQCYSKTELFENGKLLRKVINHIHKEKLYPFDQVVESSSRYGDFFSNVCGIFIEKHPIIYPPIWCENYTGNDYYLAYNEEGAIDFEKLLGFQLKYKRLYSGSDFKYSFNQHKCVVSDGKTELYDGLKSWGVHVVYESEITNKDQKGIEEILERYLRIGSKEYEQRRSEILTYFKKVYSESGGGRIKD